MLRDRVRARGTDTMLTENRFEDIDLREEPIKLVDESDVPLTWYCTSIC
jgi:hypothetical protein